MLLKELSEVCGMSGLEDDVRKLLRERLQPHVDEMHTDYLGNLRVRKGSGRLKVMVDAHTDEVALMARAITADGLIKFADMGGIDPRVLPGRRVWVGKQKLLGVIGALPPHLLKDPEEREKPIKRETLLIDIGARDKEDALTYVQPGDPIYFATQFEHLTEDVVRGKSFDDRAGCAILADVLMSQRYENLTLWGSFSSQEEVGLRGAGPAAATILPDVAVVLEATTSANVPGVPADSVVTEMGKGVVVYFMEGGTIPHFPLRQQLEEAAAAAGIPFQYRKQSTAGTNAGAIHLAGKGCPTVIMAVPCRYFHTEASLISLTDFNNAVRLLHAFLSRLNKSEARTEGDR